MNAHLHMRASQKVSLFHSHEVNSYSKLLLCLTLTGSPT